MLARKYFVCSITPVLQAVDWTTTQFWILLAKGHNSKASNFPFINSLIILRFAMKRDVLLLVTLR